MPKKQYGAATTYESKLARVMERLGEKVEQKFTVPGRPVPCVRMTQRSKYKSPSAIRYLEYKDTVGWAALATGIKQKFGPIKVSLSFYFKNNKLPDIDNLIKAIFDGLNKIAWDDDRQVVKVEAERLKDENERAEVIIREVN